MRAKETQREIDTHTHTAEDTLCESDAGRHRAIVGDCVRSMDRARINESVCDGD